MDETEAHHGRHESVRAAGRYGSDGLAGRYTAALRGYMEGGGESALQGAYEVGRHALEAGLGPLVLFSIHRDVVSRYPPQPLDEAEFSNMATAVLIESLAPFEMTQASLDTARVAVRELRATILREGVELAAMSEVVRDGDVDASRARMSALVDRHAAELEAVRERLDGVANTANSRQGLIADIVGAQEEERRRIAEEIHDDAVQVMAAVALRLNLLRRRMDDGEHLAAVEQLEGIVGESIASLRRLIAGLRPAELEQSGLGPAVRATLERAQEEFELEYHLVDLCERELSAAASGTAFRIFREALVNIRKHALARVVEVRLEDRDGGVLTRVGDDGVGFDVAAVLARVRSGHLGINAMRERAELAGGWLHIASGPDGTTIDFWIPDVGPR